MNHWNSDINDDEIRIISSGGNDNKPDNKNSKPRKRPVVYLCVIVALIMLAAIVLLIFSSKETADPQVTVDDCSTEAVVKSEPGPIPAQASDAKSYCVRKDTTVNGAELCIITPVNATPILAIGNDATEDPSAVLAIQAADIREDNGMIAGSCVVNGELVSKGEAKAGFCSIINGEMTVGVSDATPMLEQALTSDGYFFRQYPLVVAGQVVENKPKGKSIRKALAETNGRISVILSMNRLTMHDFSQALADMGVSNAIYLVGGNSYCSYRDRSGDTFSLGSRWSDDVNNLNYLVWR